MPTKAVKVLNKYDKGFDIDLFYRKKAPRITSSMFTEFKYILTDLFDIKEELDEHNYERYFKNHYENYDIPSINGKYYCICSHEITRLNFIEHIETGIIIQVGNCCVKKIAKKQGDLLTFFLNKSLCICKNGQIDRRLKSGKEREICESCYTSILSVGEDTITFGKHKGTTYKRLCQKEKKYVIDFLLKKGIIEDKKVNLYFKMELDLAIPDSDLNNWPFPEKLNHTYLLK